MRPLITLLLLTGGCAWINDAELNARLDRLDADGDGHDDVALGGQDCDDEDAAIFPGAAERCNGRDDDCDGAVDEDPVDASRWYADSDGDGAGDPDSEVEACDAPDGHVDAASDCDDTDPTISPNADEQCDTGLVDEDCDELIDDADPDVQGTSNWYEDSDGDGWGDAKSSLGACTAPSGYVADATDCDDGAADVHPEAVELCDGVDHDCDGTPDRTATSRCALLGVRIDGEESGARFASSVSGGLNLTESGGADVAVGSPGYEGDGLVTVLRGPFDTDRTLPDPTAIRLEAPEAGGAFGASVDLVPLGPSVSAGLAVGAPELDSRDGAAFFAAWESGWGSGTFPTTGMVRGAEGVELGARLTHLLGEQTSLVLGAPGSGGAVAILEPPTDELAMEDIGDTVEGLLIEAPGPGLLEGLSGSLASGDLNADGAMDLVVGADAGDGGIVVVDSEDLQGSVLSLTSASARLQGEGDEGLGRSVAIIEEASGYGRIAAGAPFGDKQTGAVFLVPGDSFTLLGSPEPIRDHAEAQLRGEAEGDTAGMALTAAPPEASWRLAVGAPGWFDSRGAAYVIDEISCVDCRLSEVGVRIQAGEPGALLGLALDWATDLDEDLLDEVALGAPGALSDTGSLFLLFGTEL